MHRIAQKIIQSPRLADARPNLGIEAPVPSSTEAASADAAIKEVLARVVTREISEVEQYLAHARQEPGPAPQPATAGPEVEGHEPAKADARRVLKTTFSAADLRALEELIESLDDGFFPDAKWKWKARALTAPSHVVHHLMLRGIRRGFFYRDAPEGKATAALA
jgi:hypothetical protein